MLIAKQIGNQKIRRINKIPDLQYTNEHDLNLMILSDGDLSYELPMR